MSNLKTLTELQELMQISIQHRSHPTILLNSILEKQPITKRQRLKIYQDAYEIRLLESLREDFFKLESLIGSESFEDLAKEYINKNPSTHQNLAEYSEGFVSFVQERHAKLSTMVVTDWLAILVEHAKALKISMTPEQIQSGQKFKIKTSPSTFFKEINGVILVAYRYLNEVEIIELEESKFLLLQYLQTEKTLDELSAFSQKINLPDQIVSEAIHEWIKKEIIFCCPSE